MNIVEKMLLEALELLDGVSVPGRENRQRMGMAEQKILTVIEGARMAERQAEAKKNADNHNEQGNDDQSEVHGGD